ncbi:MAG: carboxypeptidase-like regulatory domain-containing protein, partial [Planctomycetota bacterium]
MKRDQRDQNKNALWITLVVGSILLAIFFVMFSGSPDQVFISLPCPDGEGSSVDFLLHEEAPVLHEIQVREVMAPIEKPGEEIEETTDSVPQFDRVDGLGCYIWGIVSDEEGKPIPGANINICLRMDDYSHVRYYGPFQSDDRGVYASSLALPLKTDEVSHITGFDLDIDIECTADGYQSKEDEINFSFKFESDPIPSRLDFELYDDIVVQGRVFDHYGLPVRGAVVRVFEPKIMEDFEVEVVTGINGCYDLSLSDLTLSEYHFTAYKFGSGISEPVIYTIGSDQDQHVPDLYLDSGETLGGRVVFPDGEAVPGIVIH